MSDRDTITLPRKHIDYAAHALEHFNKDAPDPLVSEIIHHLRTALAAEQPKQEPVAKAWAEGYQQGVKDERTSEASIGIAGFGAKVEPARQNPYGTALAAEPTKPEPVATVGTQSNAAWKGYDGRWTPPGDPIKVVHLLRDLPLGTLLYTAPPEDEALRRDAERYKWMKQEVKRIPPGWDLVGWDAAIDAAMQEGT